MMLGKKCYVLICYIFLCSSCAAQTSASPASVAEIKSGPLIGYLAAQERIDSKAILPPPPASDKEMAADIAVSQEALRLKGTKRWEQAIVDARLDFPIAAGAFSCAINMPISEEDTPYTYQLLRRVATDADRASDSAKKFYKRKRPFLINQEKPCTPEKMKKKSRERSYPSAHSAIGTLWSLILTELLPEYATPVLQRGQTFSESRIICNMHWQSDVFQGRYIGAYTYSRLQANAEFQADMQRAREELARVRALKLPPTRNCIEETEALSIALP